MKITMTATIKRQCARFYTQKAKKIAKHFYIQNPDTFKKLDNIRYVLYTKSHTLDVTGFS